METDADHPQNQNNCKNYPEHMCSFSATRTLRTSVPAIARKGLFLVGSNGLRLRAADRIEKRVSRRGHNDLTLQDSGVGDVMAVYCSGGILVMTHRGSVQREPGKSPLSA